MKSSSKKGSFKVHLTFSTTKNLLWNRKILWVLKVPHGPKMPIKKKNFIECFTHRFSNSHKFQIMKDLFLIIPFSFCLSREHFPFFLTAPDGWKNTIRHNLCFSNSFKKTPQQVSGDGKRKSCLWHLTLDGRQRLRDETNMLTGDSFRMLKRSMNYPGQDLELREW